VVAGGGAADAEEGLTVADDWRSDASWEESEKLRKVALMDEYEVVLRRLTGVALEALIRSRSHAAVAGDRDARAALECYRQGCENLFWAAKALTMVPPKVKLSEGE
jgi:hypothetical protein